MKKLVIMSLLIATFWIPIAVARQEHAAKTARLVQKRFAIFCMVYVITVLYVLPRI